MGAGVTVDQVSSAVGGLWKFDQEFQPLVPFLLAKAQAGQIFLGGIDDQLSEMGQDYANVGMVTDWQVFFRGSKGKTVVSRCITGSTATTPKLLAIPNGIAPRSPHAFPIFNLLSRRTKRPISLAERNGRR
jgi:hypothetical protein